MRANEYGIEFYFNTGFDLSAQTSLVLAFTPPGGGAFTRVPTVGAVDITTAIGTFLAHQYVTYEFVEGDITIAGVWAAQLTYQNSNLNPPQQLISAVGNFSVDP